jgi:hypothetical protein
LAEAEGGFTIANVIKLIQSQEYRDKVFQRLKSGTLKTFLKRFNGWSKQFQEQVVTPVLNKSEEFVDNEFLAALTGRRESTFSMRWAMDNNKIIICKFPRGPMGKEGSTLACSIMLSKVNNAGLARADNRKRSDFTVYVDEAGMALKGCDVPSLMSESRKFGLRLVFATQTQDSISEMSKEALASILGNSGTLIVFTLYSKDAEYLDQEFYGHFRADKFVGLPMKHMIVRTLKDGSPTSIIEIVGRPKPRTKRTPRQRELWSKKVKDTSRRRFAVSKEATLEKVDQFLGSTYLDTHMDTSMDTSYRRRPRLKRNFTKR